MQKARRERRGRMRELQKRIVGEGYEKRRSAQYQSTKIYIVSSRADCEGSIPLRLIFHDIVKPELSRPSLFRNYRSRTSER